MSQIPRRNEPGGQQQPQANRDNDRNSKTTSENAAEPRPVPAARTRTRKPVNKLNVYMRGVAVLSLLIIGGVGVYKGRAMLAAKDTTVAEGPDVEKPSEPAKTEPTVAKPATAEPLKPGTQVPSVTPTASEKLVGGKKPELKKPGAKTEVKVTTAPKKPGLGGFKFGGKSDEKSAKPTAATETKGEYSLSDANPAAASAGDYSAIPAAPASATDYGSTPAPPDSTTDYGSSPVEPPAYSLSDPLPKNEGYSAGGDAANYGSPEPEAVSPATPPPSKFGNLGGAPKNVLPATATNPPASPPARLGSIDNRASSNLANPSPPRNVPPPNRLVGSNPLDSAVSPQPAAASGRYADEVDATPLAAGSQVEPHMVGLQTPSIAVEKFAPEEVQVGKPATFEIVVKNVGKVPAYDVTVLDEVPRGTRFMQASPQPTQTKTGGLAWKLGVMKPGEERVIELQLVPETEGEIGSVAQVSFQAQAGSKSIVTQPKLEIRHEAPQQVHAGEVATVRLTITNTGTGAANDLLLSSEVPDGFTHEAGRSLETKMNQLRPGESTQVNLVMKAVKAGQYQQDFAVEEADGKIVAQDAAQIEIVAPGLQVGVTGPKKRFVERQATHAITISNPGTAAAKDVDLIAYLPRGFKFVSAAPAESGGQYDARQHAVVWGIEELVAGASATVQLTTLPIEAGEQKVRVQAQSANGLAADFEQTVAVDAVSELPFTIHDLADPIEIDSETTYEIRLSNRGAKDATNVVISVGFPPELKPLDGEGAATTVTADRIQFAPIGLLAPGSEVVLKVRAQGLRAGDHRIAVSLTSDDHPQPLTREESTRVYSDQ